MERQTYPSDITTEQWKVIEAVLPERKDKRGRPRKYPLREIWNAIFYQARTGCAWRYLPHDFPPYADVFDHFSRWQENGTIEKVHDALRELVRGKVGKAATPSAAIVDSQSVKTTEKGGPKTRRASAMTPERRSRAAKGIWSLILSG